MLITNLVGRSLAAVEEDEDARFHEFCVPTCEPAELYFFDNDGEAKSIVQSRSNPMMLLRDITEVDGAMVI